MERIKLAIFASGNGSNAEQIIRYFKNHPKIEVGVVLTNKRQAGVIQKAHQFLIPVEIFNRSQFYESDHVLGLLETHHVDAVILAGFLWLVPDALLRRYPNRIVNIHPALLPRYGGAGMYGMHVHRAVLAAGETESGITIHEVNEKYDEGRIIFQAKCPVDKDDDPELLVKKIHALEHQHFAPVIERWLQ